jgi:hypothetical protein
VRGRRPTPRAGSARSARGQKPAASNPGKRSPKHDREIAIFVELCKEHGYALADVLPSRDRTELLMSTGPDGKKIVRSYPVVMLRIPGDSALGEQLFALRKAIDGPDITREDAQESISRAAIRVDDHVYSVPRPGRHHDVFKMMSARALERSRIDDQGFVTSAGRFVDRKEAAVLARAAHQLIREPTPPDMLTSEDVW